MDQNMKWMIGSGRNCQINFKLLLLYIAFVLCFITAITTLILNFYTDIDKIEPSAEYLMFINNSDETYLLNVERWMFLQIVFENTLIIEYIRILAKTMDLDFKASNHDDQLITN